MAIGTFSSSNGTTACTATNSSTGEGLYISTTSGQNGMECQNASTTGAHWAAWINGSAPGDCGGLCSSAHGTAPAMWGYNQGTSTSCGIGVKAQSANNHALVALCDSSDSMAYGIASYSGSSNIACSIISTSYGANGYSFYGAAGILQNQGPSQLNGYVSKYGGGFRIDHPTDPENHYLNHGFVESDLSKNIYNGTATFDEKGEALIVMPEWFPHVNSDPCMSLTPRGCSMPELYWDVVDDRTFKICGGRTGMKASWNLTCLRSDAWQKANEPGAVIKKTGAAVGRYMNPHLFGKGPECHEHAERLANIDALRAKATEKGTIKG